MKGQTYKINSEMAWREVDGQILILDSQVSESAHELNPMASYIFDLIYQGLDRQEIEENLIQTYQSQANQEEITNDLNLYIEDLLSHQIILSVKSSD